MFDYPLLESLYAVEKAGDFDSVARSQGVSKSAISQSLRLLEERMGAATVCRNATKPTYFGSQLCRHLEHVKLLENKFLGDNANIFKNVELTSVSVTVAVNDDSLFSWFQDAIVNARKLFKHFYIDIDVTSQQATKEALHSGKCLAAITTDSEPPRGFECYSIGRHRYLAIASPDFISRSFPDGINERSLEKATKLKTEHRHDLLERWSLAALGLKIRCSLNTHTLRSSHGIVEACLNGNAMAITSALQVAEYVKNGQLVELTPGEDISEELYWHANKRVSGPLEDLTQTVLSAADLSLTPEKLKF